MTGEFFSNEEDETQSSSSRSAFCWWRTAQEFQDHARLKLDLHTLSHLTPRRRLLRELERLALVADQGLDELRHKLLTYRSGDFWLPTGGISKADMDVPPVITILVLGLSGSGKSSLVNLMYSVLGRSGLIPFAQTSSNVGLHMGSLSLSLSMVSVFLHSGESSNYTTMFLEEHNVLRSVRSGFCVFDTRGLDLNRMREGLEEISSWMADGVRHYQPCSRPEDDATTPPMGCQLSSARFTPRPVNCAVLVVNLAEITKAFNNRDLNPVEATRDLFLCPAIRKSNEKPLLILTHGDQLKPEERIGGRLKLCEYLGVAEATCIRYTYDSVTSYALTEAVYRVLIQSDRTHLPKRKPRDWLLIFWSWIICSISAFFAFLAYFFSKLGRKNIQRP
ncbi:hypothetical protein PVL29_005538 [Vitis rotundifolia]|uniref:Uncharacterized protein n=1 Tax=Vitis rotundifolia TaxID=103349 RepID=A0AA39DXJ1_VITRO|nr:hypothetical protein PVL29_005538 [Vitis rotundifolia]